MEVPLKMNWIEMKENFLILNSTLRRVIFYNMLPFFTLFSLDIPQSAKYVRCIPKLFEGAS